MTPLSGGLSPLARGMTHAELVVMQTGVQETQTARVVMQLAM
jgi:hypothetical protein